jgi:hypothetical protein
MAQVRELLQGHGTGPIKEDEHREDKQQWKLHPQKLLLG